MKLQALENAVGFGWEEGVIQGLGRMGRKIVLHDPDQIGIRVMDIGQVAHAGGVILRRLVICHLHMPPRFCASRNTNRLAVPLRRYSQ